MAPDEHGKLAVALAGWRDRATATFLTAYRETMTTRGFGRQIRPPLNGC